MPSPYRIAAAGLEQIITTEFPDLAVVPTHDELHESLGVTGRVVGISIDRELPGMRNRVVQETYLRVQWFEQWEKDVDPTVVKDPRLIADIAFRLQVALGKATLTSSGDFWYFNWMSTEYPRDPIGNKTRFIMTVCAYANNSQLVETSG